MLQAHNLCMARLTGRKPVLHDWWRRPSASLEKTNWALAHVPLGVQGGISALAWTVRGYQLLVAERGRAATLHQLEFARQVHGAHRVVQPWAAAGGDDGLPSGGGGELHALQVGWEGGAEGGGAPVCC